MDIYIITNLKNNRQYVGREKVYKSEYFGSGRLIKEAIKEYGKENFSKGILIDNKYIDTWKECSEIEASCKLSFNTIAPKGYNKTCWEYPMPIEMCRKAQRKGAETNKRNKTGIYNPKIRDEAQRKGRERCKKLKVGFYDPEFARRVGRIGGKLGGKLGCGKNGGKKAYELKVGLHAPGMASKGGRIGSAVNKRQGTGLYDPEVRRMGRDKTKELGVGIFASGMTSKGGKRAYELKRGAHAPENLGKGGKLSAYALFEVNGILQQTTLGMIFKL